jgi:hypothetical protein
MWGKGTLIHCGLECKFVNHYGKHKSFSKAKTSTAM